MKSDKNKNVKVIYKRIEPEFFKKYGYINLNHREVNTKEQLVEIASIFRNPMYETFRIIYMKGNKIAGYESITSKVPQKVQVFPKSKSGRSTAVKVFYKIMDRMNRLGADGYYLVHNHPSGNARASKDDLNTTQIFNRILKGFRGHLIVNTDTYAWIDVDKKYGLATSEDNISIKKFRKDKYYKMLNKKSIYDVKITSRQDLVMLMHHIKNSKDYSSLIFADAGGKVRMILDLPNRFLNMSEKQIEGFINNQKALNGATRVFFATNDNEVYQKALKFWDKELLRDCLLYKDEEDKIYTYERIKARKIEILEKVDSIQVAQVSISEEELDFDEENQMYNETYGIELADEDEEEFKNAKTIKVLFKKVGEPVAEVVEIKDTLRAKQNLVGGLIEIVQYDDLLLVCNEEGKLLNMPPNLIFDFDYIAGDCFLMGEDQKTGEWRSLTEKEIEKYQMEMKFRSFRWDIHKDISPNKERSRGERMRSKD